MGWIDCSVIESIYSSCRGPVVSSQNNHYNTNSRGSDDALFWTPWYTYLHTGAYIHILKT